MTTESSWPETDEKGHLKLENGWTVSIQRPSEGKNPFAFGLYADKNTAEILAWNENGTKDYPEDGPLAYQDVDETLAFVEEVKNF